jgi:hypothetical protein
MDKRNVFHANLLEEPARLPPLVPQGLTTTSTHFSQIPTAQMAAVHSMVLGENADCLWFFGISCGAVVIRNDEFILKILGARRNAW